MTIPTLPEVLILLLVLLLVYGAGKLKMLGEALGKGLGLQDSVRNEGGGVKKS